MDGKTKINISASHIVLDLNSGHSFEYKKTVHHLQLSDQKTNQITHLLPNSASAWAAYVISLATYVFGKSHLHMHHSPLTAPEKIISFHFIF